MIQRLGYTLMVALGLVLVGFVFLGVAWNGAAGVDFPQGQIPYLISGGAVGIGLIILGATLMIFESGRRAKESLEQRLDALTEAIASGGLRAGSNGASVAPEVKPPSDAVVVGDSSFHRQGCRLVEGKPDLIYASLDDARDRGLNACRVCDPLTPDRPKSRTTRRKSSSG